MRKYRTNIGKMPSGAKAKNLCAEYGTAEAVPLQNRIHATSSRAFLGLTPTRRGNSLRTLPQRTEADVFDWSRIYARLKGVHHPECC
jgi:hypothetical protein